MPVSVLNNGVYDCEKDVYIGLPAVIDSQGIHHIVKLKLTEEEKKKLNNSADLLKGILNQMKY
ncbi:MAG TPA: L-lactate dehydrogenase, partial [Candidatus Izemoplasmatales bacterium]|nr:L-lactate dehydrogenase [Candidatus Izemoplasmatales bacterium]